VLIFELEEIERDHYRLRQAVMSEARAEIPRPYFIPLRGSLWDYNDKEFVFVQQTDLVAANPIPVEFQVRSQ